MRILTGFILLLNLSLLKAQEVNDFAVWNYVGLEKKVNKSFSVNLKVQTRLSENASQLSRAAANFGVTYKINKSFRLSAGYVYIRRNSNPGELFSNRHRLYADLTYKAELNRFVISNRLRYQSQKTDIHTSEFGSFAQNTLRDKLTVKYNFNIYVNPYIAQEMYCQLNGIYLSRSRTYLGLYYNINKDSNLEFYLLRQHDLYENNPSHTYALGIGYNLQF